MKYGEFTKPDSPPYPVADMFRVTGKSQYGIDYNMERLCEGSKPTFHSEYSNAVKIMKINIQLNRTGDVTADKRQKEKLDFKKTIDEQVQKSTKEYMDKLYAQFRHKQNIMRKKNVRIKSAPPCSSHVTSRTPANGALAVPVPQPHKDTVSGIGGLTAGRALSPAATPIVAPSSPHLDTQGITHDITVGEPGSFSPPLSPVARGTPRPGSMLARTPSPYKAGTPRLTSRSQTGCPSIPPPCTPIPNVPQEFSVEAAQSFECPSPGPGPVFFDPDTRATGVKFAPKFRQFDYRDIGERSHSRAMSAEPMRASVSSMGSRPVRSATYRYEHPINKHRRDVRQTFDHLTRSADSSTLPMSLLLQHNPNSNLYCAGGNPSSGRRYGSSSSEGNYMHQTSMFMDKTNAKTTSGPPYRGSFTIAPDWVSERIRPGKNTSHMVSSKDPNSFRYGATKYS